VFQVPWLFAGSLFDNVTLGNERISKDTASHALEAVGMAQFPLDHSIAEQGGNLSGGQKQAVSVARVLAFDPAVLLLYEPTSAMDAQLEQRLVTYLSNEKSNRTMVIVTHKSALISLCDRVWIMDGGQIAEDMTVAAYNAKTAPKPNKRQAKITMGKPGPRRRAIREQDAS
jgi:ABC-type bacteriocin/lantibiotic exporter with double-glycine peptidase domain